MNIASKQVEKLAERFKETLSYSDIIWSSTSSKKGYNAKVMSTITGVNFSIRLTNRIDAWYDKYSTLKIMALKN